MNMNRNAGIGACVSTFAIVAACAEPHTSVASHPMTAKPSTHALATTPITQVADGTFVGSLACRPCHTTTYERWKKTPMANVVRDPNVDHAVILPDLATNTIAPFPKEDVALVYGSIWKQRYFKKVGDDYLNHICIRHRCWVRVRNWYGHTRCLNINENIKITRQS